MLLIAGNVALFAAVLFAVLVLRWRSLVLFVVFVWTTVLVLLCFWLFNGSAPMAPMPGM